MTSIRDYLETDAAAVDRLAVTAFAQFRSHYADWEAMSAGLARMSRLSASGEIMVAESDGGIASMRSSTLRLSHGSGRIACRQRAMPLFPELEPPLRTMTCVGM